MKKISTLFMLMIVAIVSFSQQTTTTIPPLTKADYLKKSKRQKTAAWIMLSSTVAIIGIAAPGNISFDALGALVAVGALSAAGSITLFIASGRNKRKAMAATTSTTTSCRFATSATPALPYTTTRLPPLP